MGLAGSGFETVRSVRFGSVAVFGGGCDACCGVAACCGDGVLGSGTGGGGDFATGSGPVPLRMDSRAPACPGSCGFERKIGGCGGNASTGVGGGWCTCGPYR